MSKYLYLGLLPIILHTDGIYCICNSLIKSIVLYMMCHLSKVHYFTSLCNPSLLCILMCNIYVVMQNSALMNIFLIVPFLKRGNNFIFSLLFSEDNILY